MFSEEFLVGNFLLRKRSAARNLLRKAMRRFYYRPRKIAARNLLRKVIRRFHIRKYGHPHNFFQWSPLGRATLTSHALRLFMHNPELQFQVRKGVMGFDEYKRIVNTVADMSKRELQQYKSSRILTRWLRYPGDTLGEHVIGLPTRVHENLLNIDGDGPHERVLPYLNIKKGYESVGDMITHGHPEKVFSHSFTSYFRSYNSRRVPIHLNPWFPIVHENEPSVLAVQPSEKLRVFELIKRREQHFLERGIADELSVGKQPSVSLVHNPYVQGLLQRQGSMEKVQSILSPKVDTGSQLGAVLDQVLNMNQDTFSGLIEMIVKSDQKELVREFTTLNKYGEFKDASFDLYKYADDKFLYWPDEGGGGGGGGGGGV